MLREIKEQAPSSQFTIAEVTVDPVEAQEDNTPGIVKGVEALQTGWYRIKCSGNAAYSGHYTADGLSGRYIYNGADEYRQNATNSYPLFLQSEAADPVADDASYYIRIERKNDNRYVQSANGHYLLLNSTASRTASEALSFVYDTDKTSFSIGNYWVYFPSLGHILGKSSSAAFSANRYKIYSVSPEDEGLSAWQVSIQGAASATEVRDDVRLTCQHPGIAGLTSVYNGGYFFIKSTAGVPAPTDFLVQSLEGYKAELIDEALKMVQVLYTSRTDGISSVSSEVVPVQEYDLQGRPAASNYRGVRISRQGKKF